MKKLLAVLLALAMVFSLAACQSGGTTEPAKETTPKADDSTTKADEPTTPAETDAPLPWYMWDAAHPERYGGTIRAQYGDWSPSWDPMGQASWTTYFWAMPVFQSCLIKGDDGQVYPQICTYEMSEDGLTIKITIRDGVKFSDGEPVEAEDIIASLTRAGELVASVKTNLWDILDHYDIDGNTITFHMTQYKSGTLRGVFGDARNSNCAVMKKEICEKYGTDLIYDLNDCIGTGPYKFVVDECETEMKAVYERNEYYLPNLDNPDDNGIASPNYQYAEKLEYLKLGKDTMFMAMVNDELDACSSTDKESFDTLLAPTGEFKMEQYNSTGTYYAFFNCKEGRAMADPNLRKAIAAAFDYMECAVAMYGDFARKHDSILVDGVFRDYYERDNYRNQDWFDANDLTIAKKYLDASSYNGEELKLVGFQDSFMPALKYLDELGIKYTWTKLDNATLRGYAEDEANADQWDMIYRPNPLASTPDGWNYTFYQVWSWGEPRAQELMDQLKAVPYGTEESYKIWDELNALVCEQCPWIIIMTQTHCMMTRNDLHLRRNIDEYWYHLGYWDNPDQHVR